MRKITGAPAHHKMKTCTQCGVTYKPRGASQQKCEACAVCRQCGSPTFSSFRVYCSTDCHAKARTIRDEAGRKATKDRCRERLAKDRKENGVCVMCGLAPSRYRKRTCMECGLKSVGFTQVSMKKKLDAGLCVRCGKMPPLSSISARSCGRYCETCYLKMKAGYVFGKQSHWTAIRDKFVDQKGICPYTGENLTLGDNASVDHILPKSRWQESRFDPANCEWVTTEINSLKNDKTREEFLDLISRVYNYTKSTEFSPPPMDSLEAHRTEATSSKIEL